MVIFLPFVDKYAPFLPRLAALFDFRPQLPGFWCFFPFFGLDPPGRCPPILFGFVFLGKNSLPLLPGNRS
ncbi:MAG: hypothetical protein D6714_08260 [Bacteroidetes bacterium]|nr:MAG: hypothetical protein D6714_08260 [Bacteroidota bacterium]